MAKPSSYVCVALVLLLLSGTFHSSSATVLVPFGDTGWRYIFTGGAVDPAWFQPGFDDSRWTVGRAPFAGPDGCVAAGTSWPVTAEMHFLIARRHFGSSRTPTAGSMSFSVVGQGCVYMNGQQLWCIGNGDCALAGGFATTGLFPLIHAGDNVLAVEIAQTVGVGWAPGLWDAQVIADGVTPTFTMSWGRIKSLHR